MLKAFRTILIPVDFSVNTEVAVTKALGLMDKNSAVIYLLHVLHSSPFQASTPSAGCEKKLAQWKQAIEEDFEGVQVRWWTIRASSVQKAIHGMAKELAVDLIVIGQTVSRSGLSFFNRVLPMQLSESTGIPVLTVKPGALHKRTKTVLVPISDTVTESKMKALELLCRNGMLTVHLITFADDRHLPSEFSATALLQLYQWLKLSLHCTVEYAVVPGSNPAKATLQYAEKINADILLVHPDKETKIGWWNRHISDVLPPVSKVQVLAV